MHVVVNERQEKLVKKFINKQVKKLSIKEEQEIYDWYSEEIQKMNEALKSAPSESAGSVEEHSIKAEDNTCFKFNLVSIF